MENRLTNTIISPTSRDKGLLKINDIAFRLILAPVFGIAIPLITGMINTVNLSNWQIKFSFLYTILIAFVIWEGNRFLHFSLRSYFDWYNRPLRKLAVVLISISFYTMPVSALLLTGWYEIFGNGVADRQVIIISTLVIMICVVFITHVYETVFLVKESENEILRNEQLERAKLEAELETLKNQIDPHFIFNSLNTLSHLIEEKPASAKLFNDHLADVYRYILQHKGKELIMLREEIIFLQDYLCLLTIRFENAVKLKINFDEVWYDTYLVPPISLQLLAENAIKHNEFSSSFPLTIEVFLNNDSLIIRNRIKKKELRKESSKIGLNNLHERYKLITGMGIAVQENDGYFEVRLPVIKL